ncbi:MBL fold metallo-hydrolase [Mesoplasma chauliocola]|uniref:MBL fold metallo-hydrolase n=1 Tax=Mesoplasma chauliocola TaxID=216427 RepID=A0A249SP98_9MOLU|nr:MBL fold metallo-hydrolase [Mesoplasma chauliocola]ASZ09423.1 MBL fold metallo-hydrolase [Mesoplasma chauliocola]
MNKQIVNFKCSVMNDANGYLLVNNQTKKAILIDGGYNSEKILDFLKNNEIQLTDIFITHFHYDHTVGIDEVSLKTQANLWIHKLDFPFLLNNDMNGTQKGDTVNFNQKSIRFKIFDKFQTLTLNDFKITLKHVGGHTPGSTFYEVDNNSVFVGDTLFKSGIGFHKKMIEKSANSILRKLFDKTCNDEDFYKSLIMITKNYSNFTIYPGHWDEFELQDIISNKEHPIHKIKP